ncbi:1214_t:CDS:1, partial [Dentiscutata heterogama]
TLEKAQKYLKETINYWNDLADNNITFDLKKWIYCHTADNSLDLYLGTKGYAMAKYHSDLTGKKADIPDQDRDFIDCLIRYGEGYIFHLFIGAYAKYIPFINKIAKDYVDNRDRYWNILYNAIRERKKVIENTPKDQLKNDMMNLFLTINTEQYISKKKDLSPKYQRSMSEKETMVNISEAIAGGTDSTAGIIAFTAYFLAKYPEVVTKIRAEVEAILGKDPRPIKLEDVDKFKYVEAVIKETARISSTTPLLDRFNDAPDEVAGYHWPANTHFIMNSWGTHNDKKYWDNPEKFDPD